MVDNSILNNLVGVHTIKLWVRKGAETLLMDCRNVMHTAMIFLFYPLLQFNFFLNCYLYYSIWLFKCTFTPLIVYFQWQTPHNCGIIKIPFCGNLKFPENVCAETFLRSDRVCIIEPSMCYSIQVLFWVSMSKSQSSTQA